MRLQINDLFVRYRSLKAVDHVHANIEGSAVVAVLGPNAAGKSTFLRSIAGLQSVNKGKIMLDGNNVTKMSARNRASKVTWVPQVSEVAGAFTLRRVIELGRYSLGPSKERVDDALKQVGLYERANAMWHEASAGMRQRTAIARALAQRTPGGLMVLDEPTSALDLKHIREMGKCMRQCASEGDIVIVSLHDIGFAMDIADEVLVLQEGRLVLAGATKAVLTPSSLASVFGVDLAWSTDEGGNRHLVMV